jgi:hypothetical protein
VNKAFGVFCVGVEQVRLTSFTNPFSSFVVEIGGSVVSNPGVTMVFVVPRHEASTMGLSVFETAESIGNVGSVLEGSELAL